MKKNNITAQDSLGQYRVKGVKPKDLPKKTPYELNSGTKDDNKQRS
jgi:hypothetical protein